MTSDKRTAQSNHFLEAFASGWHSHGLPQHPSLGVEHECFVTRPGGETATHADTQRLFASLARSGWEVVRERDPVLGVLIVGAVQRRRTGDLFVKLEHHPHLIEFATPPCASIDAVIFELSTAWESAERAAAETGLQIVHEPFSSVFADDPSVWSEHLLCRRLRAYRQQLANTQGYSLSPRQLNFSAEMASTQLHFGGIGFASLPHLLANLYAEEAALAVAAAGSGGQAALTRRWSLYRATLPNAPLVGFPDLPSWTLEAWAMAAGRMPLLVDNPGHSRAELVADALAQ